MPEHTCTEQGRRKNDSVERHIVFAHKLHQLHIFGVLPPGLPVCYIVGCDADVADRRVKPHVENLVFISLPGDCCAPLEVSGDAADLQAISHPGLGHLRSML